MMQRADIGVGRPSKKRAEALRDHVIAVADALFIENGYSDTSMAVVAARARIGKQTLYRRFPDKGALFREVIRRRIDTTVPACSAATAGRDPLASLKELGRVALDLVLDPEFVCLYRIIIAEALPFPELAHAVSDNFGSSLAQRCIDTVRQAQALGVCRQGEPANIALCFLWSLIGDAFMSGLCGTEPKADLGNREAYLELVWRVFMDGMRPRW